MKIIFKIARIELASFFYSPIAWLLLAIFMVQTGIDFSDRLIPLEAQKSEGFLLGFITSQLFATGALLGNVQFKLYLFIPLLTMGLISREISSGSIKLLLTSPITSTKIILGKFLAMLLFGVCMLGILTIYIVTGMVIIDRMDYGLIFSGVLGLALLYCTYSAIGLFMSTLTAYQIVAAIATFIVFAALSYVGNVWQDYDAVRNITYYLSISGRSEDMIRGLVTSRDVIYFVAITVFFMALTYLRLQSGRESIALWRKVSRYAVLSVVLVITLVIASNQGNIAYVDLTYANTNTLSDTSVQILKRIHRNKPFKMTTYINLFDYHFDEFRPAQRQLDLKRLEPYTRFAPQMEIDYKYYYDTIPGLMQGFPDKTIKQLGEKTIQDRNMQPTRFSDPEGFKKLTDVRNHNNLSMRIVEIGKEQSVIQTTFNDMEKHDFELEFTTGIKRALDGPSRLFYITGHNERSVDVMGDMGAGTYTRAPKFRLSLVNAGFTVDTVNLAKNNIPKDADGLILLDPKFNFTPAELAKLQAYIKNGGNLIIAGEARKRDILKPILEPLGIYFIDTTLLQHSQHDRPDIIKPLLIRHPVDILTAKRDSFDRDLWMDGAAALRYQGNGQFIVKTLAVLDTAKAWLRPGKVDILDSAAVNFTPVLGDTKKAVPLILGLARKVKNRTQTIVVSGDADLFSNRYSFGRGYFNELALLAFTNKKFPLKLPSTAPADVQLNISKTGVFILKWTYMAVFPGLILLSGSVVLLRRRRK